MPTGFVIRCIEKIIHKQVCSFDTKVEQVSTASGFVMRYACFDKMPVAIKFMFHLQVDPTLFWKMQLVVRKDIAIWHLSARDQRDQRIDKGGKLGVRLKRIDS